MAVAFQSEIRIPQSVILLVTCQTLLFFVAALAQSGDDASLRVRRQLDALFDDAAFARGSWGVMVRSLDSGEILYRRNADKYLMPASNMKLVTALAAIEKLGLDYKFKTKLVSDGAISGGMLAGDLIIEGSGDPTLGARTSSPDPENIGKGDPLATFVAWAEKLKALGIGRIAGDIVGDDSAFDSVRLGKGWAWDYLGYGYAAEVSGLQFNENCVNLLVSPGAREGAAATLQMIPQTSYLQAENHIQTVPSGGDFDVAVERLPGTNRISLSGTVPADEKPFLRTIAIENPALYCATVLKETLESKGIRVEGRARTSHDERPSGAASSAKTQGRILLVHESPDLRYVLRVLLRISQNLYAESLVKAIAPVVKGKSFEGGKKQVEAVLTRAGIPSDAYVLADGSGLSRYNFLTADVLVRLLSFAYRMPYGKEFMDFLSAAGVNGTLKDRMKQTAAENNVYAKTGSIGNVRSLSGYVRTRDGEMLAFSMIGNNFIQSSKTADYIQDHALEYLANFSRKSDRVSPARSSDSGMATH